MYWKKKKTGEWEEKKCRQHVKMYAENGRNWCYHCHITCWYNVWYQSRKIDVSFCPQVSHRLLFSHNLVFMLQYDYYFIFLFLYFVILKHEHHNLMLFVNIICVRCCCCNVVLSVYVCTCPTYIYVFQCNMFMKYVNFPSCHVCGYCNVSIIKWFKKKTFYRQINNIINYSNEK